MRLTGGCIYCLIAECLPGCSPRPPPRAPGRRSAPEPLPPLPPPPAPGAELEPRASARARPRAPGAQETRHHSGTARRGGLGAAWSLGRLRRCSGVFQALWPAAVESGWGRGRARLRKAPLRKRGSSPDPLELPGRGPDLAGTEEAAGEPVAAGLCCAELKVACIPPALCRALCPFGLPASGATRGEGYKGTRSLMTRVPWDQAKYRREDRTAEDLCVNSISVFGGSVIFFQFFVFSVF